MLASEQWLAFTPHSASGTYEIQFLTEELLRESRTYYANEHEHLAKSKELQEQLRILQRMQGKQRSQHRREETPQRLTSGEAAELRKDRPRREDTEEMVRLKEEIAKLWPPIPGFRVAAVMRRGTDFIALQELETTRELLIPSHRIRHVITKQK